MKTIRRSLYFILLVMLTLATQVGGLVLIVSTIVIWAFVPEHKLSGLRALPVHFFTFITAYALVTIILVPIMAEWSGRVPLQCIANDERPYAAYSPVTCLMNRQYVKPELRTLMETYATEMDEAFPGTVTAYLEANFPLFDGFPLVPHLSHNGGLELDLSYYYEDATGTYKPLRGPSPLGYFAFQRPEDPADEECPVNPSIMTLRWEMKWFEPYLADYELDEARTAWMVRWMAQQGTGLGVSDIFIEPHLARRFGISSTAVKFAGCHAARHDDHLHVSLDPRG